MVVSVGRCYYHNDRPSVAVCSICGAGICKDCARKNNGQIVCTECYAELSVEKDREEHREFRRQVKAAGGWKKAAGRWKNKFTTAREFILPGIIGVILVVIMWIFGISEFHNGSIPKFV